VTPFMANNCAGTKPYMGNSEINKIRKTIMDYTKSFSEALEVVKTGKSIQRAGWNGSGLKVKAQFPDENSKMTLPYLYIEYPLDAKNTPGARCPWHASQTDILAEDWGILED